METTQRKWFIIYWNIQRTSNSDKYFCPCHVLCSRSAVCRKIHGHSSTPQIPGTCDTQAHCHCGNLNLVSKRTFLAAEVMDAEDGDVRIFCLVCVTWFSVRIVSLVRKKINVIHVLQGPQVAHSGQMTHVIRLRKFAIASVYLYVIFLVCYLPNTCVLFAIASNGPSTSLRHLQLFTMTLVFLNSTLNPLIYCWKMKNIRHTVVDMLRHTFSSFSRPTEESWNISTMH